MTWDELKSYRIILASKSPRRHELLKGLGLDFEIRIKEVDESFPSKLRGSEIPEFLAKKKADAFKDEIQADEILITSDTVVWQGNSVFNKPESSSDALGMLRKLNGKMHTVFTGVCITSALNQEVFSDATDVYFAELTDEELELYIEKCKPFDKAGSYGIQEWLGYAGIERIEGSFYNVMGLPTRPLYSKLKKFIQDET